MKLIPKELETLYQAAYQARLNSHSPYSGHKVGAAITTEDGKIFSGCNVENASYGATICAERGAIQTAISVEGQLNIVSVMVITDANPPWMPCGMCRQVLAEFSKSETAVYVANLEGEMKSLTFGELYPSSFTPSALYTGKVGDHKK
jgi:cytidine deaminase